MYVYYRLRKKIIHLERASPTPPRLQRPLPAHAALRRRGHGRLRRAPPRVAPSRPFFLMQATAVLQ